ncbi:MAG: hypothetical protein HQK86_12390 [Nitrospinae bacterium]|nr:hypothetical protein [Nitrospinota bacterium]MBF0634033.1 hypothetical protein [Nitrospinota bacterium]
MDVESGETSTEIKLLARLAVMRSDKGLTPLSSEPFSALDTSLRLITGAKALGFVSAEFHAQELWTAGSFSSAGGTLLKSSQERSSALTSYQRDEAGTLAVFDVDRLALRMDFDRVDVTIGRQAVNLSALYYFTPNDIFAPFSANTFYRVYKPGVDCARMEIRVSELSQLTLVHALGYSQDAGNATGWSSTTDDERSSSIAKFSATVNEVEVALLGGRHAGSEIAGGVLQGEIAGKIGVRAEGKNVNPKDADPYWTLALEADRRFESSLNVRAAYLRNGQGADTVSAYSFTAMYPARDYFAVGAGYEFSPLLIGDSVYLLNMNDDSDMLSLTLVYSTSDESEIALTASFPRGKERGPDSAGSEFGARASTVFVELRAYF